MSMNDRVQARINPELKASVEEIFSRLGLSAGEAIRLFYTQVALNDGLPFPIKIPNAETLAAMKETEYPENLKRYKNFAELREEQGV